eukprot:scaffold47868_cov16-Tisochrysis_lutea.AAC.1
MLPQWECLGSASNPPDFVTCGVLAYFLEWAEAQISDCSLDQFRCVGARSTLFDAGHDCVASPCTCWSLSNATGSAEMSDAGRVCIILDACAGPPAPPNVKHVCTKKPSIARLLGSAPSQSLLK